MKKNSVWISIISLICGVLLVGIGSVAARSVESIFAGKVLVLKKRPPAYFKRKSGFVRFLKTHSTKTVYEGQDKTWSFETMAFFKRPLGDYEVEMVFYDIKNGRAKHQRRYVNSFSQYTQDRNTRSLSGKTKLIRPDFDANRRYMIVAQSRGKELAKGEFATRGTSQAQIDQDKRLDHMQKEMEKSMKDLEKRAKEQEERRQKESQKAADDLF